MAKQKGPNPKVDAEKCIGCGMCAQICPAGLFKITNGKAKTVKGTCLGCKACEMQCPAQAIIVED